MRSEQRHLDHAYACLRQMERRTSAAEHDAAERAPGDWDATVAQRRLRERLRTLREDGTPLCFGRIDEERGNAWHIGRRHVEDDAGEPVVVDWRAAVAVPFYRATFAGPLGLRRRRRFLLDGRHLDEVLEEDFTDPDAAAATTSAAGLPDPLLATLGRSRSGEMRDIVATIAAEQDAIIRAPLERTVVVQGGPGTGKTAVGLHRAAFLLYEHRQRLEREGVLVLGPNRLFLAYVSQVLPSLGEVAVTQTTLPGLVPEWPVRDREAHDRAELKGDPRMATVLARVADAAVRPAGAPLHAPSRWGTVALSPSRLDDLLEAARASGGTARDRRSRFRRAVTATVTRELSERRGGVVDSATVGQDLGADRAFQAALARMWPTQSAPALLRRLYGRSGAAARAGGLSRPEASLLARTASRSVAAERWTPADLPLLDEAEALLTGPPRRYGHVVVDEAQDLSAMALRMVRRRSLDGRSLTVLGDLGQATAPGAPGDWAATLAALGDPPDAAMEELTVGYRVPAAIMDLANAVLAVASPHLRPTRSVRTAGEPPEVRHVQPGELADVLAAAGRSLAAAHQTVAVVAVPDHLDALVPVLRAHGVATDPPGRPARPGHLALVRPEEAKGLEFDAVVVVEPASVMALPGGPGLLYIALTRAVQHLTVLHAHALPPALQAVA